MKESIAYLNSLLKEEDTLVIGVSGGPDSMCLLHLLLNLKKKINIICAHINHNIRKESAKELKFVEKYCKEHNVLVETTVFSKKGETKEYKEQELREKRYAYFEEIIIKYKAKYLLTAHHGDDLIETILMRLTRGSNLKGYCGFQVETDKKDYRIIRPLIYATKAEIEIYNKENKIPFVIDNSNFTDKYTRNRYRQNIVPFLKQENKQVHNKYLKFSKELYKYYSYVNKDIEKEIEKRYQNSILDIQDFADLESIIKTKIIEEILRKNYQDHLYLVNDKHIDFILDIIENPKPNIEVNLPDRLHLTKSYNKLKFTRHKKKKDGYLIKIEDVTELPNGHKIECLTNAEENTNNYIRLNSQEIHLPLYVRTRKNGDKMVIKKMKSAKKLKDIFIDLKIEKESRDTQPIVVDNEDTIIWLPGLKKSKFDKAKKENYDIILWYK